MPFYELILLCKVGESAAMGTLLKAVAGTILQEGGVVRSFQNLGDRVASKNFKAEDGQKYGVARYIAIEMDGTPKTAELARKTALANTEILTTYLHKVKEKDYINRTLKRLNQELSPLKDESTKDPYYIRDMWDQYQKNDALNENASKDNVRREPEKVHAWLKQVQEGPNSDDSKTLREWAEGSISKDDAKMKNYLIKQFQKRRGT